MALPTKLSCLQKNNFGHTISGQCTIYGRTFLILLQECNKCTVSLLHTWLMIEFPVWKNKCSVLFTQVSPEIQHLVGGIPFFLFDWNQRLQISLANKSCNSWDKSHHRLRRDEQFFSFTKNIVFFSFFAAGSWEKDTIFGAARKSFCPFYFVTASQHKKIKRLIYDVILPRTICYMIW